MANSYFVPPNISPSLFFYLLTKVSTIYICFQNELVCPMQFLSLQEGQQQDNDALSMKRGSGNVKEKCSISPPFSFLTMTGLFFDPIFFLCRKKLRHNFLWHVLGHCFCPALKKSCLIWRAAQGWRSGVKSCIGKTRPKVFKVLARTRYRSWQY